LTKTAIDLKKPELDAVEIDHEIRAVLDDVSDKYFPRCARDKIQSILRRSTPWSTAKEQGKTFVPRGDATRACDRLLKYCRSHGLFVVEIGELEGFDQSVGGHGPGWVNEVLERKDLANAPQLKVAREFVGGLMNLGPTDTSKDH
jgi:hypothetical protein